MQQDAIKKNTDKFPCPGCGGNMEFDPTSGMLKCDYCDSTLNFKRSEDEIIEYDFTELLKEENKISNDEWKEGSYSIQCESCGAQTVINDDTMSKFCAFCGSSHIVKHEEITGIAPKSLIPFSVSEKVAKTKFKRWINKKWLAPNALKKDNIAGLYNGTYIPYWTFDSDSHYAFTAMAGTYYYVTQTSKGANGKTISKQVRKIRWRNVSGSGRRFFDDIQVSATSKLDKSLIDKLEPFTIGKLLPYQAEYLSGFLAERYSIDPKTAWVEAQEDIKTQLRVDVKNQILADEVKNINLKVNNLDVTSKHLLVPVWLSSYKYKNKTYQIMINGENGKVVGRSPVSPWKIAIIVLGILAIIGVIAYIISIS